ncbi:MAG: cyanamide hydratase [Burkholderiaceae bacterium]|nr:cyanamide hydratase [Microbacteriaceae bacterium]
MKMADFAVPDSAAARAALEVAAQYAREPLVAHSVRSWYWAVGFAALEGRQGFDAELLYVAAVLHDVGLAEEFDNHTLSYEHAAGHVAWALTAGAGWSVDRRARALEVIVLHNWPAVDPELDLEGYLLETATGLDISGNRADDLPAEYLQEVLAAYPRRGIAAEFALCVVDQANRKPDTAAARLVRGGLVEKLFQNPLEGMAR